MKSVSRGLILGLLLWLAEPALAIDLGRAEIETLDNGLTVAVLEDRTFPVVSVQVLYRVGARNEQIGRTGLAHFLEHMAFRATPAFPDTEVVSAIYAVGGEWHGYTWTDQTTYFETVPREYLDLVLQIEAERMGNLLIPESEVEAERGAVLAELHGYENDPGTVLLDTVVATSFLQHPYRHNTIGWESDLESIEHADLIEFYRRHYRPTNAVLAVVGDVEAGDVMEKVRKQLGQLDRQPSTPSPGTVEPPQQGARRVEIEGQGSRRLFNIAYRAPSVRSPDWPAFLVLQEVLGGGDGVNFLQNEWGVPAGEASRLQGVTDDLSTWYPPSHDPYLLVVSGSVGADREPSEVESRIEDAIAATRRETVAEAEMDAARQRVLEALVFDVETTEDAAHQLASYLGYGAFGSLLQLPGAVAAVSAADVQRVARTYLQPWQRTIGWYQPTGERQASEAGVAAGEAPSRAAAGETTVAPAGRAIAAAEGRGEPVLMRLSAGLPVIFQRVEFSPTAHLRVLVPTTAVDFPAASSRDRPVWRHTSIGSRFLAEDLEEAARRMRWALDNGSPDAGLSPDEIDDPGQRLELAFADVLGEAEVAAARQPRVLALVGDLDRRRALEVLEKHFGDLEPAGLPEWSPPRRLPDALTVQLPVARAQAQLGYVVVAPPPARPEFLAWRILLYVLTHGYEGRLGKEAISRRGLLYYIDSDLRSDGESSVVTLSMGVDPQKLEALAALLARSLRQLQEQPPTVEELREAQDHLIGRRRSAAQSNAEISAALLSEWVDHGRLRSEEEFIAEVRAVSRERVLTEVAKFLDGTTIRVENPE